MSLATISAMRAQMFQLFRKCPDRASIGKMGTARKTRKVGVGEGPSGLESRASPEAVAADRASYRTIGPDAEGQRLDNYLIRIAKGVPKATSIASCGKAKSG